MTDETLVKRRKVSNVYMSHASAEDENHALDPSDVFPTASEETLARRKIAKATYVRPSREEVHDDDKQEEETFEEIMKILNTTFATFVQEQIGLRPYGDLTKAAQEYVEYVRQLRKRFGREDDESKGTKPTTTSPNKSTLSPLPKAPSSSLEADTPPIEGTESSSTRVKEERSTSSTYSRNTLEEKRRRRLMDPSPPPSQPASGVSIETPRSSAAGVGWSTEETTPSFSFGGFGASTAPMSGVQSDSSLVQPPAFASGYSSSSVGAFGAASASSSGPPGGAFSSRADHPFTGFLASANTLSTNSIWKDDALLQFKVDAQDIERHTMVFESAGTEIWHGTWKGTTPVALKRLPLMRQTIANAVAFATNVKTVIAIHHPRIVAIIGAEWTKATDFQVATEFMERGDLRSVLDTPDLAATLTWENFKCQVAIDIADALAFVHSQSSVPSFLLSSRKVLLSADGRAKLSLLHATTLDDWRGSFYVRYMAREMIQDNHLSSAADIYSFGVLLCELDSTFVPFHDATSPNGTKMGNELIAQQLVTGLLTPAPSTACPEPINQLIQRCIATDPSLRPTATSVAYTLRQVLKEEL